MPEVKTDKSPEKNHPLNKGDSEKQNIGVLFGVPENESNNLLVVGGKKTGYLYAFKKGRNTFVHTDDQKEMEKRFEKQK